LFGVLNGVDKNMIILYIATILNALISNNSTNQYSYLKKSFKIKAAIRH